MHITNIQHNKEIHTKIPEDKVSQNRKNSTLRSGTLTSLSDEVNFQSGRDYLRSQKKHAVLPNKTPIRLNKYTFSACFTQNFCINIQIFRIKETYFDVFIQMASQHFYPFFPFSSQNLFFHYQNENRLQRRCKICWWNLFRKHCCRPKKQLTLSPIRINKV